MEEIILQIYLGYGAYRDGKEKRIPLWYLILGLCTSLILLISKVLLEKQEADLGLLVQSLLPGIVFLLYYLIKKAGVGMGDGLLLCIMGIWCMDRIWKIWYLSLVLFCCYGLVMMAVRKSDFKTRIPYFPFLWLAHLLCVGGGYA